MYDWIQALDEKSVATAVAQSDSVLVCPIPGLGLTAFVRQIDDLALSTLAEWPDAGVNLWYPESLAGVERIESRLIILTTADRLDLGPLYSLSKKVRSLYLNGLISGPRGLRIGDLQHVRDLSVPWEYVSLDAGLPPCAERLSFLDPAPPRIDVLPASETLTALALSRTRMADLDGVQRFPNLESLSVAFAPALSSIEALDELTALSELEFGTCSRINDLEVVGRALGLRRLGLMDCGPVASLAPVGQLRALEELIAFGSTKIVDGDLSPLLSLENLRVLAMAARRHYRPSLSQVKAQLGITE